MLCIDTCIISEIKLRRPCVLSNCFNRKFSHAKPMTLSTCVCMGLSTTMKKNNTREREKKNCFFNVHLKVLLKRWAISSEWVKTRRWLSTEEIFSVVAAACASVLLMLLLRLLLLLQCRSFRFVFCQKVLISCVSRVLPLQTKSNAEWNPPWQTMEYKWMMLMMMVCGEKWAAFNSLLLPSCALSLLYTRHTHTIFYFLFSLFL